MRPIGRAALMYWLNLPADKEIGLGVIDPRTTTVESPEFVIGKVRALLKFAADQIFLNPDCGFGTFADRPVNTSEIAQQKLNVIRQAASLLRAEHGGV